MGKHVKQFLEKFPPLNELEADVGFFLPILFTRCFVFNGYKSKIFLQILGLEASSKGSDNLLLQHETGEMGVMVTRLRGYRCQTKSPLVISQ